jgi:hypothetical protein
VLRALPRRRIVGRGRGVLSDDVEQVLRSIPFHGRSIGGEVAPLEG